MEKCNDEVQTRRKWDFVYSTVVLFSISRIFIMQTGKLYAMPTKWDGCLLCFAKITSRMIKRNFLSVRAQETVSWLVKIYCCCEMGDEIPWNINATVNCTSLFSLGCFKKKSWYLELHSSINIHPSEICWWGCSLVTQIW